MPRVEKVTQQVNRLVQTRDASVGGAWSTYSSLTSSLSYIRYVTRDDVVKSTVKAGFRPPLGYTASGYNAEFPAIYADALYTGSGTTPVMRDILVTGYIPDLVNPPQLVSSIPYADTQRAIVNMLRAVGDSKWSAGEMIAEMQGSIDMIAKSARTLDRAMMAATRRNWRGVARALSVDLPKIKKGATTGDGWLSFNFGWAPVVSDIANSALFLSGAMDSRDPPIIMARTRLRDQKRTKSANTESVAWGSGLIFFPYQDVDTTHDEWQASVYFTLDASFFRGLAQYGMVGLSTPWATLPFSFLADWILPIGDYLEAMDATIGLSYLGGSETRFRRSERIRKFGPVYGSSGVTIRSGTAFAMPTNRFGMERSVWNNPPMPVPVYVKNPFDVFKAVTSVALLRQYSSKQ